MSNVNVENYFHSPFKNIPDLKDTTKRYGKIRGTLITSGAYMQVSGRKTLHLVVHVAAALFRSRADLLQHQHLTQSSRTFWLLSWLDALASVTAFFTVFSPSVRIGPEPRPSRPSRRPRRPLRRNANDYRGQSAGIDFDEPPPDSRFARAAQIERRFWKENSQNAAFSRKEALLWRDTRYSALQKADQILDEFVQEAQIDLDDQLRDFMLGMFTQKLFFYFAEFPLVRLGKKKWVQLLIKKTEDDGSCGFHALIGEDVGGIYTSPDGRKRFCHWLQERIKERKTRPLPLPIREILEDYFRSYRHAPKMFRTKKVNRRYGRIRGEWEKLEERRSKAKKNLDVYKEGMIKRALERKALEDNPANREKLWKNPRTFFTNSERSTLNRRKEALKRIEELLNEKVEAFIMDGEVLNAYLNNLRKRGTWLLQQELHAAAICFDKAVHLFQPQWGFDGERVITRVKLNDPGDGSKEVVHIWYDGEVHYQRTYVEELIESDASSSSL